MARTVRILVSAALLAVAGASPCWAQASSSSSSGSAGSSSPSPSSPAPSGGAATGRSAAGEQTPVQKHEQERMKKETTICKGC